MKKILFLLASTFVLFAACQQLEMNEPNYEQTGNKLTVKVAIDDLAEQESKSVVSIPENGISDVTLFFFLNDKLAESIYTVPESNGAIIVESTKGYPDDAKIDVYGLINMGDKRSVISEGASVSTIQNYAYSISSVTSFNTTGFPMAGLVEDAPVGTEFTLKVQRLVAKYGFRINTASLKYGTFEVTSLKLKNAAKEITPFVSGSKVSVTSKVMDGDYATSANINSLRAGTGVYFYSLENCQGTLLPSNTDPWKKVPDNISAKKDLCTYIEVIGTYKDKSGGLTAQHTYRMYLGQDNKTNFDVIRNTKYEYTLTLADDGFLKATWKAERLITSDVRSMSFVQSKYDIENDEDCYVSLNYNPAAFDCNYSLSSNLTSAGVTFDPTYMVLRQTKQLDEDVTGTLTATSWDKELTTTCTVVAKKYDTKDIVIIVKPDNEYVSMAKASYSTETTEYGLELALVNSSDEQVGSIETNIADWDLSGSGIYEGKQIFTVEIGAQTKSASNPIAYIKPIKEGWAPLKVKYTYNGQTYTTEQRVDIKEDRTISFVNNVSRIDLYGQGDYSRMHYQMVANFTGTVNATSSSGDGSGFVSIFGESGATFDVTANQPFVCPVSADANIDIDASYGHSLEFSSTDHLISFLSVPYIIKKTCSLTILDFNYIDFDFYTGNYILADHHSICNFSTVPRETFFFNGDGEHKNIIYAHRDEWRTLRDWYRSKSDASPSLLHPDAGYSVATDNSYAFMKALDNLTNDNNQTVIWSNSDAFIVSDIVVTSEQTEFYAGHLAQFNATATLTDDSGLTATLDITDKVTWTAKDVYSNPWSEAKPGIEFFADKGAGVGLIGNDGLSDNGVCALSASYVYNGVTYNSSRPLFVVWNTATSTIPSAFKAPTLELHAEFTCPSGPTGLDFNYDAYVTAVSKNDDGTIYQNQTVQVKYIKTNILDADGNLIKSYNDLFDQSMILSYYGDTMETNSMTMHGSTVSPGKHIVELQIVADVYSNDETFEVVSPWKRYEIITTNEGDNF